MLHALTITALAVTAPAGVQQDAQAILEEVRTRQVARWDTVDNYTVFQKMDAVELPDMGAEGAGMEVPMHYQKHVIDGRPAFGLVPGDEYRLAVAQAEGQGGYVDPEALEAQAEGQRMLADAFETEMAKSGVPMLPGMNEPSRMLRETAMFSDASAEAVREAEAGDFGRANAAASLQAWDDMTRTMRLVGREEVDGREAYHLRAEDLDRDLTEPGSDRRFTLEAADVWIDAERYVVLRTAMEGEIEADGQTRDVTLEQLFQDWREVGPLYESHRQVMRMSGLMGDMDPEQREELEETRRQMEEMEAQLDEMPAAARGMIEAQMEKARAQMDMLANDGFEMVSEVVRIEINTGPPPPGSTETEGGS